MWLLDTKTRKLKFFSSEHEVPGGYAILSHTWSEDETSFDQIHHRSFVRNPSYRKIEQCCKQALSDLYAYVWIDTCCIDKRSSAELSEAINSMFRWYAGAQVCYAYLADVDFATKEDVLQKQLLKSHWFTRGWTLQELIAPQRVIFFDRVWTKLGEKCDMLTDLSIITRIDRTVLEDRTMLRHASVAKRMSWAAGRETTRVEDRAYSLLGLFDVSMPMLYGEGEKAFRRLQEEIIRTAFTADHSILAWTPPRGLLTTWKDNGSAQRAQQGWMAGSESSQLFAPSPDEFKYAHNVVSWGLPQMQMQELSSQGLRLVGDIKRDHTPFGGQTYKLDYYLFALNCRYEDKPFTQIALRLTKRKRIDDLEERRYDRNINIEETLYDRDWSHESSVGRLISLDTPKLRDLNWSRSTITLAWQRFFFPAHGDLIHIAVDSCRIPLENISGDYKHQLLRLDLLDDGSKYGKLRVEVPTVPLHNNLGATVHMKVEPDKGGIRPPRFFASLRIITFGEDPIVQFPDGPFDTGETRNLNGKNGSLSVSARYVLMAGELLWSVKIGPMVNCFLI